MKFNNVLNKFDLNSIKFKAFFVLVFIIFYTFILGRDRYTTTSSFMIVGSNTDEISNNVNRSLLVPSLKTPSYQDAKSLEVFLNSPRTYKQVFHALKTQYKPKFPDLIAGLRTDQNFDNSYNFYKRQFLFTIDDSTGIITLKSYGFDSGTSLALNEALITQSNIFLDEINRNIFEYNVSFSKKELDSALDKLEAANKNLIDFKFVNGQLDETVESTAASNYLAALQKSLVEEKVKLASLLRTFSSQDSPEINLSKSKISSLEQEISEETQRISGSKDNGIAARAIKAAQLQSLVELERSNVSEVLLSLSQAKTNSIRKEKFISVLSSPFLAAKPDNTWRFKILFSVLGCYILALGISKTLTDLK